jgi:methyl-accepting chemotaxis protein
MLAARPSRKPLWSATLAIAFVSLLPLASSAQPAYPPPPNPYASDVSAWQRLQQLSVRLESLALRTRDEARIGQRHRGSEELAEQVNDFAKDAHRFRLLMNERNVPASKINDEIRKLVDRAGKVQKEMAKTDRHNPRTDADWGRAIAVLDEINNQYLAANGLAASIGTSGYDRSGVYRGRWTDNRRTILNDLDRRAEDAARLSESANLEIAPEIERLRDQVRSFRQSMDRLSPDDTRANIAHLLADARAVQADLAGSNAPGQLRDDVNSMVGTLVQMRDMTAEGVAGTRGYGPAPGIGTDRYATMDLPQLVREFDNLVSRASELAAQSDLDDVASEIARFRDKARDFDNSVASMSPEERREAIDRLLENAQKTQRNLARRHVSADLMTEWNAVVDLLVRLRGAA